MKKILTFVFIGLWGFNIFGGMTVFASGDCKPENGCIEVVDTMPPPIEKVSESSSSTSTESQSIKVMVTEEIPGMKCAKKGGDKPENRKYECEIQPGFESVMFMFSGFIKYATFIVALLGVLMLVYSGIEMSMAGVGGKKDDAKKRIEKVIMGLVLLFMIGFILNSVAPWIYQ